MRNGFDGLRHHLVVGGNHQHDDVGDLRTARTHGREGFVTRRVEEGDRLATGERDVVCADVLRDTTGFTSDDVRLADVVEQRRLAVVNVTHDRDDRRTRHEVFRSIDNLVRFFLDGVFLFLHGLEAELAGDQLDLVEVETLVDGDHQPEMLECEADDFCRGYLQDLREFRDRDEFIDAHSCALTLGGCRAERLELFARCGIIEATTAARRTAQRRHRLRDVRIDGGLIDRTALALLAATTTRITTSARRRAAGSRCTAARTRSTASRGTYCRTAERRRRRRHRARAVEASATLTRSSARRQTRTGGARTIG